MPSRRSFLANIGTLAVGAGGIWLLREYVLLPRPKVEAPPGVASSGWLPFAHRSLPVVTLEVTVDGAPVTTLVDSGAQISVIDQTLAGPLSESGPSVPVVTMGVEGGARLGRTTKIDMQLGSLSVQDLGVAVLDLAHMSALGPGSFSAILGDNALSALVADIDFPRRRIAFHRPENYALPEGAVSVAARSEDRRLMVPVTVAGAPMEVALDTGASAALALSRPVAERMGLLKGRAMRYAPSLSLGGVTSGAAVQLDEMAFAGETYRKVLVQLYEGGPAGAMPAGLLGFGALRRFRVIINRGAGTLHLLKAQ